PSVGWSARITSALAPTPESTKAPLSSLVADLTPGMPKMPPVETSLPEPMTFGPATTLAPATGAPPAPSTRPESDRPFSTVIVPTSVVSLPFTCTSDTVFCTKVGPVTETTAGPGGAGTMKDPSLAVNDVPWPIAAVTKYTSGAVPSA